MCNGPCHDDERALGWCCPSRGSVRGFLQSRVVLLLLQKPAHGYELIERLAKNADMPGADPGLLYRTLRQLENEGLLRSIWDTKGQGPARRLYEVTPEGVDFLHAWATRVKHIRQRLGEFLTQYEAHFEKGEEG
ncbi:MAG: PadR family transcriptional regulator [Anaerolineae bacterium]